MDSKDCPPLEDCSDIVSNLLKRQDKTHFNTAKTWHRNDQPNLQKPMLNKSSPKQLDSLKESVKETVPLNKTKSQTFGLQKGFLLSKSVKSPDASKSKGTKQEDIPFIKPKPQNDSNRFVFDDVQEALKTPLTEAQKRTLLFMYKYYQHFYFNLKFYIFIICIFLIRLVKSNVFGKAGQGLACSQKSSFGSAL